tara:strand:+ start:209 stop:2155 length:1947 start_codon:yes stop_codon:yes gene_type:complete
MIEIFINKKSNSFNFEKKKILLSNLEIVYDNLDEIKKIVLSKKEKYFFYGKINYLYDLKSRKIRSNSDFLLKKIIKSKEFYKINNFIDGKFLIIKVINNKATCIISDKFCKIDLFYNLNQNQLYISNLIKNFKFNSGNRIFNNISLANILMNYGSYVPKSNTIYENINRLNINEYVTITEKNVKIKKTKLNLIKTSNEFNNDENLYYKKFKTFFLNSIKRRCSNRMNWVYISSGFDSTSILATLNYLVGNKKITAVIAQIKYSNKYGVCNKFEIERTQKICDYFKIPLKKVKLDYSKKTILSQIEEVKTKFKSRHIFSITTNNFYQMAKYIKKKGKNGDRVFNGDLSDGLQNFGFSQFATILDHPSLSFREYADKMFSYIYSPSFFQKISQKKQFEDKVFNFIQKEKNIHISKDIFKKTKKEYLFKFLSPLFLSPSRFPFTNIYNDKLISKKFREKYSKYMYQNYFKDIIKQLKTENLYSSIIHLYNTFHWNSGTVQCCLRSSEVLGVKSSTPFWDSNLLTFFSEMPENWGRGLDIRNTKYVLKNFLKNDIDYPTSLQTGPHSYIYDIDSRWSADLDILYHSYLRTLFVKILKNADLKRIFKSNIFNIKYIKFLQKKYYQKKYIYGSDLLTLKNLIIFLYFVSDKNLK